MGCLKNSGRRQLVYFNSAAMEEIENPTLSVSSSQITIEFVSEVKSSTISSSEFHHASADPQLSSTPKSITFDSLL